MPGGLKLEEAHRSEEAFEVMKRVREVWYESRLVECAER